MDTQKHNVILWTEFDKAPDIASFCLTISQEIITMRLT